MTSEPIQGWKYTRATYIIVVSCWVIYAILTLVAPSAGSARYHVSPVSLALIRLTVILPIHLVWLIATRGAVAFKSYAAAIRGSREATGLDTIANGLLWTLAFVISMSLCGAAEPFFFGTAFQNAAIILRDHIPPLAGLVAFFLLYRGSHGLRSVAKFTTWTASTIWILVGFIVFSVAFVLEFATVPASTATMSMRNSTSVLPNGVLLFTLVLPYVVEWFMGILASINIFKFSANVKGILYRKALRLLVWGIVAIVAFTSAVQFISFADQFLANLSIGLVLAFVYVLIAFYALGFVLIWRGARQLERLEAPEE